MWSRGARGPGAPQVILRNLTAPASCVVYFRMLYRQIRYVPPRPISYRSPLFTVLEVGYDTGPLLILVNLAMSLSNPGQFHGCNFLRHHHALTPPGCLTANQTGSRLEMNSSPTRCTYNHVHPRPAPSCKSGSTTDVCRSLSARATPNFSLSRSKTEPAINDDPLRHGWK